MSRDTVQARLVADFTSEFASSDRYLTYGFGLGGEILVATRQSREEPTFQLPGFAIFPKSQLEAGSDYRLLVQHPGQPVARVQVRGERIPCAYVQPVPDGVLVVGARCSWRQSESEPEKNAVVFDHCGVELRRFCLGDGINDVRVDRRGFIWVSYFDEGIFGNYGWEGSGRRPLGAPGLVKFDGSGNSLAEYDAEAAGTDAICDAYAINLASDDDVWVYFYTDFPIVHWHRGTYRRWRFGEGGANAMAVRNDRVALYGGEGRLRILALEPEGSTRPIRQVSVEAEDHRLGPGTFASGVGEVLYLVDERRVFTLTDW